MNINHYNIPIEKDGSEKDFIAQSVQILFVLPQIQKINQFGDLLTKIGDSFSDQIKAPYAVISSSQFIQLKEQLIVRKKSMLILAMGITPKDLVCQIDHLLYHPLRLQYFQFIFADDIAMIAEQKKLKVALWNAFKSIEL